ncbi:MAG: hypothetical protein JO090_11775 [Rhizobacter sp.]|nr:hypothetical protein [Rhizobacter sp.]
MRLPRPRLPRLPRLARLRREPGRPPAAAALTVRDTAAEGGGAARQPHEGHAPADAAEAGFRASSYELRRGLDVLELPSSLPADVLDRLFKSPQR